MTLATFLERLEGVRRSSQLNGWDMLRFDVGADVTVSWRATDARLLETWRP